MSEAERKVWMLPELVAKLFSELDPESVLNLARVVDKEVLKESMTSKMWNKIITDLEVWDMGSGIWRSGIWRSGIGIWRRCMWWRGILLPF